MGSPKFLDVDPIGFHRSGSQPTRSIPTTMPRTSQLPRSYRGSFHNLLSVSIPKASTLKTKQRYMSLLTFLVCVILYGTYKHLQSVAEWDRLMGTQSYRSYIHAVETHGLGAALRRARQEVASHSDHPKVAYLFLGLDGHSQDSVWQDFFEHADEDKYNIYVHRSYPTPEGGKNFLQKFSSYHETPIISSAWCALMGVQYALLAAALRDPTNQQFVFISHNTVPFKNFDFIYDDLIGNSMSTSKFCFASMMGSVYNDCHFFDTHRAQRADTLKHHQWIILSREHSQTVLYEQGRQSLNYYDSLRALKDGVYNDPQMCSDETVPSLALILKAKAEKKIVGDVPANVFNGLSIIGVEERCTTFAYWARCLQRTPFDLGEKFEARQGELWHPLSMSGIPEDYLTMLVNEPSLLFGRKFNEDAFVTTNNGSTINVADILPKIIHSGATFSAKALEERPLPRLNTALDGSDPVEGASRDYD